MLLDALSSWKTDLVAMLASVLLFVYGPPHIVFLSFLVLVGINLFFRNKVHRHRPLKERFRFFTNKMIGYTVFIFMANSIDIFLGKSPEYRNYILFGLFIIESTQTLGLLSAAGYAKEVKVIQYIYTSVIKKNPFGEVLKEAQKEVENEEKKTE